MPHVAAQQALRAQEAAEERSIAREKRVAEQRADEAAEERRIEKQIQRKRDDEADKQEDDRAPKHRDNSEERRRAQAEIDRAEASAEESQHRHIHRDAATNDALLNYQLHEDDGTLDIQDLTDFEREELRYNGGTRRKYRKDD